LLETLARNPKNDSDEYEEAIKYTNKFLEKEFRSINNWLSRTKEDLPAKTRELIKGNDLHQRDARKSLASASSSTDSFSDKCLRFLRLVSLKYSK
jgi:hypothetical protein